MARIILALLAIALTSFVNATPQRGGLGSLGATNGEFSNQLQLDEILSSNGNFTLVPHGPAPGGCSKYEVIVGKYFIAVTIPTIWGISFFIYVVLFVKTLLILCSSWHRRAWKIRINSGMK